MFIVLAILALGLLIIVHEGGHYVAAKLSGMRVDRFSVGFGPQIASFKRGETVFQVAAIPLGGFVQIAGLNPGDDSIAEDDPRSYNNRPVLLRLFTIFAGPATNYIFAALAMSAGFLIWGVPAAGRPVIAEPEAGMPAAQAGLLANDEIVTVDGKAVASYGDVPPLINGSQGRTIPIEILRDGKAMTFQVTPVKTGEVYRMGAALGATEVRVHSGPVEAIKQGVTFPVVYSAFVLSNLGRLFSPKSPEKVSGTLGIVHQMSKQIEKGMRYAVDVVAIISVALGLFNLLPFPALDGGRMVFLGWELLARRRFPQKAEATIHLFGLGVLLSFMLYVTFKNDIPSFFKQSDAQKKPPAASPAPAK